MRGHEVSRVRFEFDPNLASSCGDILLLLDRSPRWFNHEIFFSGIDRADSSEDELDESILEEEGEEEKGTTNTSRCITVYNKPLFYK